MNRILALVFAVTTSAVFGAPINPIRPPIGHPLVGKWQWTRSANNCTEVYDFRPDGTAPVVSGAERTDNVFKVAARPDPNGFYRVTIKVLKDYGGKDCGDDESDSTGVESTSFLLFNPTHNEHLACLEAKPDKCFGPLKRVDK
ncbi:hypothetical protein PLCT2_03019 [Planctomycetaceae bacterium]|nr:hypothetical protein PLCT2_03019 [Planctomycetaceae bacterium]